MTTRTGTGEPETHLTGTGVSMSTREARPGPHLLR
ncbi:hypothetical protein FHS43_005650 [Streptosporangium becharense]|uniref:Uncharacterized protein n=1 Tax=Streptosporangium becharense TaxID=1816182 RepID=A0A7W9MK12_9ACTN|nr:hypothetical protein [Streptosporangium becharense]MBB5823630.1 hypothetical protein [Streptosporangium becharense]